MIEQASLLRCCPVILSFQSEVRSHDVRFLMSICNQNAAAGHVVLCVGERDAHMKLSQ